MSRRYSTPVPSSMYPRAVKIYSHACASVFGVIGFYCGYQDSSSDVGAACVVGAVGSYIGASIPYLVLERSPALIPVIWLVAQVWRNYN